jgi:hypothetical protein
MRVRGSSWMPAMSTSAHGSPSLRGSMSRQSSSGATGLPIMAYRNCAHQVPISSRLVVASFQPFLVNGALASIGSPL